MRRNQRCIFWLVALLMFMGGAASAATLKGRVFEADSRKDIVGAYVFALTVVTLPGGEGKRVDIGPAKTQADGNFTLKSIPRGKWQILVIAEGYEVRRALLDVKPTEENETFTMDLPLQLLPVLSGTLIDPEGEPLAETQADFALTLGSVSFIGKLKTDTEGRYRLFAGRSVKMKVGSVEVTNTPDQEVTSVSVAPPGTASDDPEVCDIEMRAAGFASVTKRGIRLPKGAKVKDIDFQFTIRRGRISGRVVSEDGEPMADVEVMLRSLSRARSHQQRTFTNAQGRFAFDDLDEGIYMVQVVPAPGIASLTSEVIRLDEGEHVQGVLLQTQTREPSNALSLVIYEEDGVTPLANETVKVIVRQVSPEARHSLSSALRTNRQGRQFLMLPSERGTYRVFVSLPGFCHVALVDTTKPSITPLKIVRNGAPRITCKVAPSRNTKHETRNTTDLAYLHLKAEDDELWQNVGEPKEGKFVFCGLAPGTYFIALTPLAVPNYYEHEHLATYPPVTVKLKEGSEPVTVSLALPAAGSVFGKVLGKDDMPLPFVAIHLQRGRGMRLSPSSAGQSFYAQTDQEGQFQIVGIPFGTYALTAQHRAYEPLQMKVTVTEENIAEKELVLHLKYRGLGTLKGRVLDEHGKTAENVRISVQRIEKDSRLYVGGAMTRSDGTFSISDLPPGLHSVAAFSLDGNVVAKENVMVKGDATVDMGDIKFPPPARVVGKVKAQGSELPERLEVVATPPGFSGFAPPHSPRPLPIEHSFGQRIQPVNRDGSFAFTLPPGTYEFFVRGEGISKPPVKTLTIKAGERAQISFTLPRGGTLEGVVMRIDTGEPVARAIISVHDEIGNPVRQTVTDVHGNYRIRPLMPGHYTVRCRAPNLAFGVRHDVAVEEDSFALCDFSLSRGASIKGKLIIKDAPENVPSRFLFSPYRIMVNVDVSLMTSPGSDGNFRLDYLPPGRHLLAVYRGGEQVAAEEVELKEGEEKEIVLEVEKER